MKKKLLECNRPIHRVIFITRPPLQGARRPRVGALLIVLAVLAPLAAAGPGKADHNYSPPSHVAHPFDTPIGQSRVVERERQDIIIDVNRGYDGHRAACACDHCGARREYDRGYERGRERGYTAGYRDAGYGQRFNDCAAPPCDRSRQFQRGFSDGFACAYRDGFERGLRGRDRYARSSCVVISSCAR